MVIYAHACSVTSPKIWNHKKVKKIAMMIICQLEATWVLHFGVLIFPTHVGYWGYMVIGHLSVRALRHHSRQTFKSARGPEFQSLRGVFLVSQAGFWGVFNFPSFLRKIFEKNSLLNCNSFRPSGFQTQGYFFGWIKLQMEVNSSKLLTTGVTFISRTLSVYNQLSSAF